MFVRQYVCKCFIIYKQMFCCVVHWIEQLIVSGKYPILINGLYLFLTPKACHNCQGWRKEMGQCYWTYQTNCAKGQELWSKQVLWFRMCSRMWCTRSKSLDWPVYIKYFYSNPAFILIICVHVTTVNYSQWGLEPIIRLVCLCLRPDNSLWSQSTWSHYWNITEEMHWCDNQTFLYRLRCWTNTCFWPPSPWSTLLICQRRISSEKRTSGRSAFRVCASPPVHFVNIQNKATCSCLFFSG